MADPIIVALTPTTGSASGSLQTLIQISNGCFARKFGFTPWNKIRLAMRYRMVSADNAVDVIGTPNLAIGFCSGTDQIPGDTLVKHFIGLKLFSSSSSSIWMDGVTNDYRYDQLQFTTATSASGYTSFGWGGDPTYGTKSMVGSTTSSLVALFFDVQRGSGSYDYTCSRYTYENDPAILNPTDITYYSDATFLIDIETDLPAQSNYLYTSFSTQSMLVDEAASGSFDAICVWWGRIEPVMQIHDLYVVRLF
jgi:hypothetical protein